MNIPSRFQRSKGTLLPCWSEKPEQQLKREEEEFQISLEYQPPWWHLWARPLTEEQASDLREACVEHHRGDFLAVLLKKFATPSEAELQEMFDSASEPALIGRRNDPATGVGQFLFLDFQALNEIVAAGKHLPGFLDRARAKLSGTKEALRQPCEGRSNRQELIAALDAMEIMKNRLPDGASEGRGPEMLPVGLP